jgi:dienelactone hydrolase
MPPPPRPVRGRHDDRREHPRDAHAAQLAWQRTLALFERALRG